MGQRQRADLSVFGRIKFITGRNIGLNANTLYVAAILSFWSSLHTHFYASVGGATRHTVIVVSVSQSVSQSVSLSVATISRSSLKTNR